MCTYTCACVCVCIGGVSVFMYMSVRVYVSVFLSVFVCVRVFVTVSECVSVCQHISVSICVCVYFWRNTFCQFIPLLSSPVVEETSVNKHLPTTGLETHRFGSLTEIFQALPSLDASVTQERCTIATSPHARHGTDSEANEAEV